MLKFINQREEQLFAFNIWSIESAKSVIDGCAKYGNNAFLQTSMKAYEKIDKKELREFVSSYATKRGIGACLHLDHCKDVTVIEDAIEYGWDSVMIDASDKSLEQNIAITNQVTEYAHARDVMVEAEVGQISGKNGLAEYQEVCEFINHTSVDLLAIAIGTAHGLYHGTPQLSYNLLEKVIEYKQIPLVIHGGTGLDDDTLVRLLSYNQVKKINISTDVKLAYRKAIVKAYDNGLFEKDGFDPLVIIDVIQSEICSMVESKQKLLKRGK